MEANKADWNTMFEPYPFFEVYKNYLQIDVTAANPDDLSNGKGWVESCLRQLTLKVRTPPLMLWTQPFPVALLFFYYLCMLALVPVVHVQI